MDMYAASPRLCGKAIALSVLERDAALFFVLLHLYVCISGVNHWSIRLDVEREATRNLLQLCGFCFVESSTRLDVDLRLIR